MQRFGALQSVYKVAIRQETWPDHFQHDPRWNLALRVVSGSHFARSLLLTKFLLFVIAETIEGRENEITEHQIGVRVFDRPPDYRTVEDNIVRNYARQLRKRLAEHFAGQGSSETLRVDIPLGGYIPAFTPVLEGNRVAEEHTLPAPNGNEPRPAPEPPRSSDSPVAPRRRWKFGCSLRRWWHTADCLSL